MIGVLAFFVFILSIIIFFALRFLANGGTDPNYQHDADIVRLNDIEEIAGLIEEYKEKTEEYPFATGSDVPSYTYIATDEQLSYLTQKPPYKHTEHKLMELIEVLEQGLGKEIKLPFDPQKIPVNKPNFYVYMTYENHYVLAVHLHNEFSFAEKIVDHYNKLQVSDNPSKEHKIWTLEDLKANKDFQEAKNEKMFKKDYFEEKK